MARADLPLYGCIGGSGQNVRDAPRARGRGGRRPRILPEVPSPSERVGLADESEGEPTVRNRQDFAVASDAPPAPLPLRVAVEAPPSRQGLSLEAARATLAIARARARFGCGAVLPFRRSAATIPTGFGRTLRYSTVGLAHDVVLLVDGILLRPRGVAVNARSLLRSVYVGAMEVGRERSARPSSSPSRRFGGRGPRLRPDLARLGSELVHEPQVVLGGPELEQVGRELDRDVVDLEQLVEATRPELRLPCSARARVARFTRCPEAADRASTSRRLRPNSSRRRFSSSAMTSDGWTATLPTVER